MITTQSITLQPNTYFRILLQLRFNRNKLVYTFPLALALLFLLVSPESSILIQALFIFGIVNPLWNILYLWIHTHSAKMKSIAEPRTYSIVKQTITAYHEDETTFSFEIEDIVRTKKTKDYLLLYFRKDEFLYLPNSAFENNDYSKFIDLLTKSNISV